MSKFVSSKIHIKRSEKQVCIGYILKSIKTFQAKIPNYLRTLSLGPIIRCSYKSKRLSKS